MPIIRLRRYGHNDCEHDIPIDITITTEKDIPDRGDRLAAPVEGEFMLVVEKYMLESPVGPAIHSNETLGIPKWEVRVIRLEVDELVSAACASILMAVDTGRWETDEDADDIPPLMN